jgi:hypothetical protein
MNTPTVWEKQVISSNQLRFISESTFGGNKVADATLTDGKITWSTDDVPHFVIERAESHFGLTV